MQYARSYAVPNARGCHARIRLEVEGTSDAAAAVHRDLERAIATAVGAVPSGPVEGEATGEGEELTWPPRLPTRTIPVESVRTVERPPFIFCEELQR